MTDERLRELERKALAGDRQAMAALLVAEARAGSPAPRKLAVLSYRVEYRIVHHGDTEASASNTSSLESTVVETEQAAADYIVKRLLEDPWASHCHVVFLSWDGVLSFMDREKFDASLAKREWSCVWNPHGQSIMVAHVEVDDDGPSWQAEEAAEAERISLRINTLVNEKLVAGGPPKRTGRNALA